MIDRHSTLATDSATSQYLTVLTKTFVFVMGPGSAKIAFVDLSWHHRNRNDLPLCLRQVINSRATEFRHDPSPHVSLSSLVSTR